MSSRPRPTRSPIHLLLPLGSSLLVVIGLTFLKRAQERGVSAWTVTILFCWTSALVFLGLTLLGGKIPEVTRLWQPAVIGLLFLLGQLTTVMAVKWGDVSIAAPVLGTKVLIVPAVAVLILGELPSLRIWIAAAVAMVGVMLVQWTDRTVQRSRIVGSVVMALIGGVCMAVFDLLIQRWAPDWGAGAFLPIALGCAALMSFCLLPLSNAWRDLTDGPRLIPLVVGCLIMAVQAIGMTYTLAEYGDASRVNIVYSLRGLWGVALTWVLLTQLAKPQDGPSHRVMATRLAGAVLIGVSVVMAIF